MAKSNKANSRVRRRSRGGASDTISRYCFVCNTFPWRNSTEIPTDEGKFYIADVLDLHSRRCVGFAMDYHHDPPLTRAALCLAIAVRGGTVAGVVFHRDQGGEYTGDLCASACQTTQIAQSMGRTGSASDNAVAESFN